MENLILYTFSMPVTEISKQEIVDIALKGFLKNGIQSFTIKKITKLTGISTKTVYKFFDDKSDLLKVCLQTHYSNFYKEVLKVDAESDNPIEAMLSTLNWVVKLEFKVNPKFYRELNQYYPQLQDEILRANSKIPDFFIANLKKGKQEGLFILDINEELIWITFQRLYRGITRDNIYAVLNVPTTTLLYNTVLVFLRGMCTTEGLQVLKKYELSVDYPSELNKQR